MAEDRLKAIYDQDCQFMRYQDGLMWSRFQTAATIEAAMLYGIYQVVNLGLWEKRALAAVGSILVALTCVLTFADRADAKMYKRRIEQFEKMTPLRLERTKPWTLSAPPFLFIVLVLLAISNLLVVFSLFWPL